MGIYLLKTIRGYIMILKTILTLLLITGCSLSLVAEDKNVGVDISTVDLLISMSNSDVSKPEQKELEELQTIQTEKLESKRQKSVKRIEEFNTKKNTLSEEAQKKEEQELIA